jgi:protein-arginine deiminase
VVFTVLRGVDVAGAVAYDPAHPNSMDTLNSFGNLETIPPYTFNGTAWPNGRVVRGSTASFYPDQTFNAMVNAQGEQDILAVDTSWLLVAHIDETISFVKASSPRGWVMLAADPSLAVSFFQQLQQSGYGNTDMFVGKNWSGGIPAQISVTETLNDTDVMNESAWAATEIDGQLTTIKNATGLTDAEIVTIPFLFQQASGYSVAFQPGTVNGVYLSDTVFGAPDPHGPVIGGVDVFKDDMEDVLSGYGVTVSWIEDWDLYHRLDGEVHCGTNVTRAIPTTPWWQ